jgi:hypothetical protein
MLVLDTFMLAKTVKIIPSYNIYFRAYLNYSDGSTTFFKEINITTQKTFETVSSLTMQISNSNLFIDFVYPKDGYILNGSVEVTVSANGSETYFEMDDLGWVTMVNVGDNLWSITVNTSEYADGEHLFAAKTIEEGNFAYKSIRVTFKNGAGSEPGVGAEWEGKLNARKKGNAVEIKLEVWIRDEENKGNRIPLSDAYVNISVKEKDSGEIIYSGITGLTDSDGKFEGIIANDNGYAIWYLTKGIGSDINLGNWEFESGKYVVIAEVRKNGKLQYFEDEFKY